MESAGKVSALLKQLPGHRDLKYRSEIDGLRAFSVLSVVIFHAFPSFLEGGFIGVDVFFVISGYLITRIIFEELDNETFSFISFFGRRVRRIFPALILVMATSLVLGWFVLLADEYAQLGKHIASGAAFIINFTLVNESGYFDNAAETKPMLHLWSLAVEEQFYIIWPLMLWLAWKKRFNLLTITVVVVIASFALNLKFIESSPVETFFWPVSRFWELLSGSVLAWLMLYKKRLLSRIQLWLDQIIVCIMYSREVKPDGKTVSNLMSLAGTLILAVGIFRINEDLAFPGMWALFPVTGALLIIAAGSKAWLNRVLLMNPVAVWFGLISYPLYLWHWPILSFLQILEENPHRDARIAGVLLSIFLAWMTYRFVELKIRHGKDQTKITVILLLLLSSAGGFGFILQSEKGFDQRVIREGVTYRDLDAFTKINHGFGKTCIPDNTLALTDCANSKKPNALLWGDSFAMHLVDALLSSPTHLEFRQQTFSSCPPILDYARIPKKNVKSWVEKCISYNKTTLAWIKSTPEIEYVILSSPFTYDRSAVISGEEKTPTAEVYYDLLVQTVSAIVEAGKKPVIVSPPPASGKNIASCWRRAFLFNKTETCDFVNTAKREETNNLLSYRVKNAPIIRLTDYICDEKGVCSATINGKSLFRDSGHLSRVGSKELGRKIDLAGLVLNAANSFDYNIK